MVVINWNHKLWMAGAIYGIGLGSLNQFWIYWNGFNCSQIGSNLCFTCPIRCARSMAWRSFIGFQSCSTNTTVSAPVKLRPSPPTWVVSKRTSMEGSLLNLWMKKASLDLHGCTCRKSLNPQWQGWADRVLVGWRDWRERERDRSETDAGLC